MRQPKYVRLALDYELEELRKASALLSHWDGSGNAVRVVPYSLAVSALGAISHAAREAAEASAKRRAAAKKAAAKVNGRLGGRPRKVKP
jgi:hypothetical protein